MLSDLLAVGLQRGTGGAEFTGSSSFQSLLFPALASFPEGPY